MKFVIKLIVAFLPWPLKRMVLQFIFGYKIDPSAYIGLSWIYPGQLVLEKGARIDHFNLAIHLDSIILKEYARVGRNNWITGMSVKNQKHFTHQKDRIAALILEKESAITKNHHIDCTNLVSIGAFTILGGYHTQILTHSIDFINNKQHSNPIHIGSYCFVGTRCVLMGGAVLPNNSILGANSLMKNSFDKPYTLYAGSPAIEVKSIPKDAKYFLRTKGFVN